MIILLMVIGAIIVLATIIKANKDIKNMSSSIKGLSARVEASTIKFKQ